MLNEILEAIGQVEFFYLNRTSTLIYNQNFRKCDQPRMFGGWCWSHKNKEGGPFRTISAARVDAYYRAILNKQPPKMSRHGMEAESVLAAKSRRNNKVVLLRRKNNG